MPRVLPDGTRNVFRIQRLKDKLGNRSNASSEIELDGTWARMVGEQGRGVPTIIEMVNHTRLDCMLGSAAGMRRGVAQATHHAAHRSAFGKLLADQPLMRNVLADLCVESEAATVTVMRVARAYDARRRRARDAVQAPRDGRSASTGSARGPHARRRGARVPGRAGYVEESDMPRLYRESPLNSIWEGSGNVICLDVLRAIARSPQSTRGLPRRGPGGAAAEPRLASFTDRLEAQLEDFDDVETRARALVESLALALQGSLLVRYGDPAVADAFCASRLDGEWGRAFGTLPAGVDFPAIVERHRPGLEGV